MKNTFLSEMNSRGFLNQCTDLEGLKKILNQKTIKAYIGFDTTAPSLHVGSLMQIMILRLLQKYGHQPIVLLGGGTTLIGDPSGKDSTRKILKHKDINDMIIPGLTSEQITDIIHNNTFSGLAATAKLDFYKRVQI